MKYIDVLKEREVTNHCPLCEEKKSYMLQRGKYCYVTTPRAPYTSDHILIAPIRHVVFLHDLSPSELKEFYEFVSIRTEKIHTYHKELILLCKDGLVGGKSGKSIDHLHFHIIPDITIEAQGKNDTDREFYEDKEFANIIADMKKKYQ